MGSHYHVSSANDSLKRNKLCLLQVRKRLVNHRKAHMAVHHSISVAGEMLCYGHYTMLMKSLDKRTAQF